MAYIVVVFEPDEDCTDPGDKHHHGRRHAEWIPEDADALLIWRTREGDPDAPEDESNHEDIHVVGFGIYENVTLEAAHNALAEALALPEAGDGDEPYSHA